MSQAGPTSLEAKALLRVATQQRRAKLAKPKNHSRESKDHPKNHRAQRPMGTISRLPGWSHHPIALGQAHFGGRHMTTRLLRGFVLRQSVVKGPDKHRQKHHKKTDTESAPISKRRLTIAAQLAAIPCLFVPHPYLWDSNNGRLSSYPWLLEYYSAYPVAEFHLNVFGAGGSVSISLK